jgi:hypothetical protein
LFSVHAQWLQITKQMPESARYTKNMSVSSAIDAFLGWLLYSIETTVYSPYLDSRVLELEASFNSLSHSAGPNSELSSVL